MTCRTLQASSPPVFHPWRLLRSRPEITAVPEKEPGRLGSWCTRTRVLRYDPGQNQAERRCTLTHELLHAERGDTSCDWRTHRDAARLLIDIKALGEALAFYGDDLTQVAEELWVDEETLAARLEHLHPSERGYLRRRLEMKERTA